MRPPTGNCMLEPSSLGQARVADGHIPRLSGFAIPPHRGFSLLPCAAGRWGARIAPHRLGGAGSPDQVQTGVATPLMNAGGESGGGWPSVAFGTAHIAGHSDEPTEGSVSGRLHPFRRKGGPRHLTRGVPEPSLMHRIMHSSVSQHYNTGAPRAGD